MYELALKKFAEFSGRSRRSEFWTFTLVNSAILSILYSIGLASINPYSPSMPATFYMAILFSLAILIPSLAVTVRRLHDTGRSGWMILVSLIPIIGGIILLIFAVQDSQPGANQYGPNPKEVLPD